MTDRKKPGVAFWATVGLVVVLVGYPLNFGPACWVGCQCNGARTTIMIVYRPLYTSCGAAGQMP